MEKISENTKEQCRTLEEDSVKIKESISGENFEILHNFIRNGPKLNFLLFYLQFFLTH